jgi:restriction system protein
MTQYNRIMAGAGGLHATECVQDGFIGVDYQIAQDLTNDLPDNFREFNAKFIPIYLAGHPDKTKIGAGLACGFTWTIAKGLKQGDIVISPDGAGCYHVGEITGGYFYKPGGILPHRRPVAWYPNTIERSAMSETLRRSTSSTGTCCDITQYAIELKALIGGHTNPTLVVTDPTVEDPAVFALEKYLQDFLVSNWAKTDLGKKYDIYTMDGVQAGQQFVTDTGPMDILAVSKDGTELLVVELKKGRASDAVVGQVQRYMGYLMDELAEPHQTVKGVIIALEDDLKIRRALRATRNISFYRYQVSFTLIPLQGATNA